MAVYDLEEQEQISELKAWWAQYGNLVVTLAVVAALSSVGWQACGGEAERPVPDVYVVSVGEAAQRLGFHAAETLREHGFAVLTHCGGGSFKSQMKKADASEAPVAIVIGEDEAAAGEVGLKPLRFSGAQQRVPIDELVEAMAALMFPEEDDEEF